MRLQRLQNTWSTQSRKQQIAQHCHCDKAADSDTGHHTSDRRQETKNLWSRELKEKRKISTHDQTYRKSTKKTSRQPMLPQQENHGRRSKISQRTEQHVLYTEKINKIRHKTPQRHSSNNRQTKQSSQRNQAVSNPQLNRTINRRIPNRKRLNNVNDNV